MRVKQTSGTPRHRGPDGEGCFITNRVALGLRRLAIVDVLRLQQPVRSEDGSVVAVVNGEIYNLLLSKPKLGMAFPRDDWLRGRPRDLMRDSLLGAGASSRAYFENGEVRKLVELHERGFPQGQCLWAMLMFELWLREFVDRR